MTIHRLEEMTWEEVERLDRDRTIVMLPLSPIEEHGPHLPLGTDFFGARDMASQALELLERREPGLSYVLVPGLPVGTTDLTKGFPGTLHLAGRTLYLLVRDLLESLARTGFRFVVIANHHLDLTHAKALDKAATEVMRRRPIRVIEPASPHLHCSAPAPMCLGGVEVDSETDVHAGAREASFIAYRYPHLLRECYRDLPPVLINVGKYFEKRTRQLKFGFPGLAEMGAPRGYVGSPASANAEFGREHLEEGARLLADCALALYRGEPTPEWSKEMRFVLRFFVRL